MAKNTEPTPGSAAVPAAAASVPPAAPPSNIVTIESLQAENDALKKQIADLQAAKASQNADEAAIAEKMGKGLSRAQAISVIQRGKALMATPLVRERQARVPGETPEIRARRLAKFQAEAQAATQPPTPAK